MRIATLRKRVEFERIRGGGRFSTAAFVMEGKPRPAVAQQVPCAFGGARFGFTISKKVGIAIVRNRIRRRLRAALLELGPVCADPQYDYVVVARPPAFDQPFSLLKADLEIAFKRVHEGSKRRPEDQRRKSRQS